MFCFLRTITCDVSSFSGLLIFDCPFAILQRLLCTSGIDYFFQRFFYWILKLFQHFKRRRLVLILSMSYHLLTTPVKCLVHQWFVGLWREWEEKNTNGLMMEAKKCDYLWPRELGYISLLKDWSYHGTPIIHFVFCEHSDLQYGRLLDQIFLQKVSSAGSGSE